MKKNIPYGHQWIDSSDIREVVKVLKNDWLTQGPKVEEFEKAAAKYCGAKYAVAVSSGTAALHAAYAAAGITAGDEIITTPLTFAATANAAVYCGGVPVFVDIQRDTLNIDPKKIEEKISPKTKAIVPVDFAGHPCDYEEIFNIVKKYNLLLIEDAAHSIGAKYKGKKIGGSADMTILSFHPVKAVTTGEGGMVLTNKEDLCGKLKKFRQHGAVKHPEKGGWYYEIEDLGYNYRLTDFQCALGVSQLKKLEKFIRLRKKIAARYKKAFSAIQEITIPAERDYVESAWHIYPVRFKLESIRRNRKEIFEEFQKLGIGVQVHYIPLHFQPFYKKQFGYGEGSFPEAEKYYREAITLPLFPKMTEQEIEKVIASVKKVIKFCKE